jgi:hypothetical protein
VKNTHFLDSSEGEGGKPGAWKVDLNEKTLAGLGQVIFLFGKIEKKKCKQKKGKSKNAFPFSLSQVASHTVTHWKSFHQ